MNKKETEINIENKDWKIECWLEEEKLKIQFKSPISLPIYTSSNKAWIQDFKSAKLENDKVQKIFKTVFQSITTQKYNTKIKDSFKTFYIQRGFQELLSILRDPTISDKKAALKDIHFDVTKRIKKDETISYVNEYKQYKEKADKVRIKEIEGMIELLLLPLKSGEKQKEFSDEYQNLITTYKNNLAVYKKLNIFSLDDFKMMFLSDECAYCGISLQQLDILRKNNQISSKSGRGFNLEIDRKEPNLEYTQENCCMSCYWCNNAKTDEFVPSEFKDIAKGINRVWNEKLKENDKENETICFPENSPIWDK